MTVALPVAFVDTTAASLCWRLGMHALPALATKTVVVGDFEVEMRVLGASHQVMVHRGGEVLCSETIACMPGETYLPAIAEETLASATYSFTSHVEAVSDFDDQTHSIVRATESDGNSLVASFPGSPSAVTALSVSADAGVLAWKTWHAYPQTREIVTTRSTVAPA